LFGTGDAGPWVAVSRDGIIWEPPRRLPDLASGDTVVDVIETSGQVAAIVNDPRGGVGILARDAGGAWHTKLANGLAADTLARVEATDGGLVALGADPRGPAAWASSDGAMWRPIELPAEATAGGPSANLISVAVVSGRAYLTGQLEDAAGRTVGALWTGPASLLAP
jgi:hypothetical protein